MSGSKEVSLPFAIFVIIFSLVMSSFLMGDCDGEEGRRSKSRTSPRSTSSFARPQLGSVNIDPGTVITIGGTKDATKRVRKLFNAGDSIGIAQMKIAGQAFSLEHRTRLRIISPGILMCEVRVESGEHRGRSGFIEPEFIQRD